MHIAFHRHFPRFAAWSRRLGLAAAALSLVWMPSAEAQNPAAQPAAQAARPRRLPQGGSGPIKVLVITRGHEFEREPFFTMLDKIGADIFWTHVEHPAADVFLDPKMAEPYDVLLFYDLAGWGKRVTDADGKSHREYPSPSPELKKNFEALVKQGKGLVFLHHSSSGWAHHWPEYSEVIGGACDWYAPTTIRGVDHPNHGYFGNTAQHITVVDKTTPLSKGLGDGFDMTDEAYACAWFEDSVHPWLRTDFKPEDPTKYLNAKWPYSNLAGWYKASENSPVVYIQLGHNHTAWENDIYPVLLGNALKWASSKEALDWAKKNHTKIFK
jgi:type 1 glutamine amidotransferase